MKQAILLFTVMLICMMASSAFSTEARPYDPMRPRPSPGGDDFPWDTPKEVAQDNKYSRGGGDIIGALYNEDCISIMIGSYCTLFQLKLDCLNDRGKNKQISGIAEKPAGKK